MRLRNDNKAKDYLKKQTKYIVNNLELLKNNLQAVLKTLIYYIAHWSWNG